MYTNPLRIDARDVLAGDRIFPAPDTSTPLDSTGMREVERVEYVRFWHGIRIYLVGQDEPVDYLASFIHNSGDEYTLAGPVWAELRHPRTAPAVLDAAWLNHKAAFSQQTFGPGARTLGVVDHIRKELDEILEDPADLNEWVDVIILGLDGASRAGHASQDIIDAIIAKQARNEARTWPDWRTMSEDQAIEHDRTVPEAV